MENPRTVASFVIMLTLAALLAGCSGSTTPVVADIPPTGSVNTLGSAAGISPTSDQAAGSSYLLFNQRFIEGTSTVGLDFDDVDMVFWKVFSGPPDTVHVYPSENYYYFIMYEDRKQLWGNIRLPAGRRATEASFLSPTSSSKSLHL